MTIFYAKLRLLARGFCFHCHMPCSMYFVCLLMLLRSHFRCLFGACCGECSPMFPLKTCLDITLSFVYALPFNKPFPSQQKHGMSTSCTEKSSTCGVAFASNSSLCCYNDKYNNTIRMSIQVCVTMHACMYAYLMVGMLACMYACMYACV